MDPAPGVFGVNAESQTEASASTSRSPGAGEDFSRLLAEASDSESREKALSPAVIAYNERHLLGGQFPPPDSGVGFLHTAVSLLADESG